MMRTWGSRGRAAGAPPNYRRISEHLRYSPWRHHPDLQGDPMPTLLTLLDQTDHETLLLPEFQRGYVWTRDQVRGLFRSLYRGYPVGSLLTWETDAGSTTLRGSQVSTGIRRVLLDGQQRITSLYGVIRGQAPRFFEGRTEPFTGLYFDAVDEVFEFYAPAKMKADPRWFDVSALFADGVG